MSTESTAEDAFNEIFNDLSALAAAGKPIPANFGAPDAVVQPAADPVATAVPAEPAASAEPVVAAEPVAASGDPAAVSAPVVPSVQPVVAQTHSHDAAVLERLADLIDRRQPPAAAVQQPQPQPVRLYTDEQIAKMQAVDKDYPDVAEYVQLLLRGSTVQNNAYLMNRINEAVAPTQEAVQAVGTNYHLDTLHRTIPDYDNIYDPVTQWVATDRSIPPPLRAAYRGVMESGEVSDVKWLTDEWRKASGKLAPAPAKANEPSEAVKQAAASLAPVVSRATAVVTSADPVTYNDMWDKLAAEAAAEAKAKAKARV